MLQLSLSCFSALLLFSPAVPSDPPAGQHHVFTVAGSVPGDRTGAALAAAGDVDGDGFGDVLVGAPRADVQVGGGPVHPAAGRASVVSGRTGLALLELAGAAPFERFGTALDGAGDANGDGLADLLFGAPFGAGGLGRVRLVSGADGADLRVFTGAGGEFGHALTGNFDADGDGVPDVAVGSPRDDGAGSNAGRLSVFSGADGALLWERFGAAPFDQLGAALDRVADLDGDGVPELVVGVPFDDTAAFNAGAALVLSGRDGSLRFSVHGALAGDQLGFDVRCAGDVDGDGTADIVVAAPGGDSGGLDSGEARVVSGLDGALLLVVPGSGPALYLSAASGAGDADGDGHADLVVGEASAGPGQAGCARIVSGVDGALLAQFTGGTAGDWLGAAVAQVGDLDGDGRAELGLGAPGHDDDLAVLGSAVLVTAAPRALATDTHLVSLAAGGLQALSLAAPLELAGAPYLLLGSTAVASTPIPVGSVSFPLHPGGGYFLHTLLAPGAPPLTGAVGLLDAAAGASAGFSLGAGTDASLAGAVLFHAGVVFDGTGAPAFASCAVPVVLIP